ncbi:MAG: DUF2505 domain-containing protein [Myxococcales bacterium]|jgi:hypothetical protein|nr:DUF2505 domain-containing protein [Myxococcales bacterium]MBL0193396.1 DUF2505 domain-containing protein [Myxococcales bacterium]HQY62939.1 DUF2505 domain-containing protein [Polyangiaceae bacterium]
MKFRCEHRFTGITLAQYEKMYFDEAFNTELCKVLGLTRSVVSYDVTDTKVKRVVRVAPNREIPAPAAKILGAAKIEYTETIEYVFGSGKADWSTVSSVMTDKVDSRGTVRFAERDGAVVRSVDGDVTVKITLLGGTVEKFIVSDVERSYEKAAEFTRDWLSKHPPA